MVTILLGIIAIFLIIGLVVAFIVGLSAMILQAAFYLLPVILIVAAIKWFLKERRKSESK